MNQKTVSLLSLALGLLLMRWYAHSRAEADIDVVARLRQAGAL